MINLNDNEMRELYRRKRNGLKESLRRKIKPISGLNTKTLTSQQLWRRFTSKSPEDLQQELIDLQQEMGPEQGTTQFKRYLNAMMDLGRERGEEDSQYAQMVLGQFAGQIQLG